VESRKKFVKMVKNGYAQKYRQTAREIGGASPEKEKEVYGAKDLQKRKVLNLK